MTKRSQERPVTANDGYKDTIGNIEASDEVVNGVIEAVLAATSVGVNVALEIVMKGSALEGVIEAVPAATPDDPSRIAQQIRDYLSGVRRAAMQSAREAIESKDED